MDRDPQGFIWANSPAMPEGEVVGGKASARSGDFSSGASTSKSKGKRERTSKVAAENVGLRKFILTPSPRGGDPVLVIDSRDPFTILHANQSWVQEFGEAEGLSCLSYLSSLADKASTPTQVVERIICDLRAGFESGSPGSASFITSKGQVTSLSCSQIQTQGSDAHGHFSVVASVCSVPKSPPCEDDVSFIFSKEPFGVITSASPKFCDVFGWTSFEERHAESILSAKASDQAKTALAVAFDAAGEGRSAHSHIWKISEASGSTRLARLAVEPVFDTSTMQVTHIKATLKQTDVVQWDEAVTALGDDSELRLIALARPPFTIVHANDAWRHVYCFPENQAVGQSLAMIQDASAAGDSPLGEIMEFVQSGNKFVTSLKTCDRLGIGLEISIEAVPVLSESSSLDCFQGTVVNGRRLHHEAEKTRRPCTVTRHRDTATLVLYPDGDPALEHCIYYLQRLKDAMLVKEWGRSGVGLEVRLDAERVLRKTLSSAWCRKWASELDTWYAWWNRMLWVVTDSKSSMENEIEAIDGMADLQLLSIEADALYDECEGASEEGSNSEEGSGSKSEESYNLKKTSNSGGDSAEDAGSSGSGNDSKDDKGGSRSSGKLSQSHSDRCSSRATKPASLSKDDLNEKSSSWSDKGSTSSGNESKGKEGTRAVLQVTSENESSESFSSQDFHKTKSQESGESGSAFSSEAQRATEEHDDNLARGRLAQGTDADRCKPSSELSMSSSDEEYTLKQNGDMSAATQDTTKEGKFDTGMDSACASGDGTSLDVDLDGNTMLLLRNELDDMMGFHGGLDDSEMDELREELTRIQLNTDKMEERQIPQKAIEMFADWIEKRDMQASVCLCNAAGELLCANEMFTRVTGWRTDEIKGPMTLSCMCGEETDRTSVMWYLRACALRVMSYCCLRSYKASGELCWLQYCVRPAVYEEAPCFLVAISDVTSVYEAYMAGAGGTDEADVIQKHMSHALQMATEILFHVSFLIEEEEIEEWNSIVEDEEEGDWSTGADDEREEGCSGTGSGSGSGSISACGISANNSQE